MVKRVKSMAELLNAKRFISLFPFLLVLLSVGLLLLKRRNILGAGGRDEMEFGYDHWTWQLEWLPFLVLRDATGISCRDAPEVLRECGSDAVAAFIAVLHCSCCCCCWVPSKVKMCIYSSRGNLLPSSF